MTTYQDVVRANGGVVSWALAEAAGLTFSPWLGWATMTGTATLDYQQSGPFASAFSLGIHPGGKLALNLLQGPPVPWTFEMWVYYPSASVASGAILWYHGDAAVNGTGLTVTGTTKKINQYIPPTPYILGPTLEPDAWHLIQWACTGVGKFILYIDGQAVYGTGTPNWSGPSPNTVYVGGYSAGSTGGLFRVSYPSIYGYAMELPQAYASFLAATDPLTALAYTQQGSAAGAISDTQLLELIYAAVHKVW